MAETRKLELLEPKDGKPILRGRKKSDDYVPRLDKEEYLDIIGLSDAEKVLCKLDNDELAFVVEMISNGCDKVKAYKATHKCPETLTETQYRKIGAILRKEEVKQLLRRGIQKRMSESLDNLDARLLETYITRAFYDMRDFVDDDGEPISLHKIPEKLRCVIDGVEKKYYGKDAEAYTVTYKFANRDQALKVLGEYISMVRPNSEISVTSTVEENAEDEAQRLSEMSYEELMAELKRVRA